MFRGTQFPEDGEPLPGGGQPAEMIERWQPWVQECLDLLDGDGAFRHFPGPGSRREQAAFDMDVLRVVRQEWVRLQNEKIEESTRNGHLHK